MAHRHRPTSGDVEGDIGAMSGASHRRCRAGSRRRIHRRVNAFAGRADVRDGEHGDGDPDLRGAPGVRRGSCHPGSETCCGSAVCRRGRSGMRSGTVRDRDRRRGGTPTRRGRLRPTQRLRRWMSGAGVPHVGGEGTAGIQRPQPGARRPDGSRVAMLADEPGRPAPQAAGTATRSPVLLDRASVPGCRRPVLERVPSGSVFVTLSRCSCHPARSSRASSPRCRSRRRRRSACSRRRR